MDSNMLTGSTTSMISNASSSCDDPLLNFIDASVTEQSIENIIEAFSEVKKYYELPDESNWTENLEYIQRSETKNWRAEKFIKSLINKSSFEQHVEYFAADGQRICEGKRILVIGAGPVGLRFAIEAAFMGAIVDVVELRDGFGRNNCLHLWPFLVEDLKNLEFKMFHGKFCSGTVDHISIRIAQNILMKLCLILGVNIYHSTKFLAYNSPKSNSTDEGWTVECVPRKCSVNFNNYDIILAADGKRNTLKFPTKEFRAKLALGITCNFVNKGSSAENNVDEVSGKSFTYDQHWFKKLAKDHCIDLENIVYYRDETHYFVMTGTRKNLLRRGVLKKDYNADPKKLTSSQNINKLKLINYALDAAKYATVNKLPHYEFALDKNGEEDVALFDFTSLFHSLHACKIIKRHNHSLLLLVAGDTLIEPFWPTGSGLARGFLGAFDAAWTVRGFIKGCDPLELIEEREAIYQLLPQTTPESLLQNYSKYSIDPHTRYNLSRVKLLAGNIKYLYDTDDQEEIEKYKLNEIEASPSEKRRTQRIAHIRKLTGKRQMRLGGTNESLISDGLSRYSSVPILTTKEQNELQGESEKFNLNRFKQYFKKSGKSKDTPKDDISEKFKNKQTNPSKFNDTIAPISEEWNSNTDNQLFNTTTIDPETLMPNLEDKFDSPEKLPSPKLYGTRKILPKKSNKDAGDYYPRKLIDKKIANYNSFNLTPPHPTTNNNSNSDIDNYLTPPTTTNGNSSLYSSSSNSSLDDSMPNLELKKRKWNPDTEPYGGVALRHRLRTREEVRKPRPITSLANKYSDTSLGKFNYSTSNLASIPYEMPLSSIEFLEIARKESPKYEHKRSVPPIIITPKPIYLGGFIFSTNVLADLKCLLNELETEAGLEQSLMSVELIKYIFRNCQAHSMDEEYYRIPLMGEVFYNYIWRFRSGRQFMLRCQWVIMEDRLVLSLGFDLSRPFIKLEKKVDTIRMKLQSMEFRIKTESLKGRKRKNSRSGLLEVRFNEKEIYRGIPALTIRPPNLNNSSPIIESDLDEPNQQPKDSVEHSPRDNIPPKLPARPSLSNLKRIQHSTPASSEINYRDLSVDDDEASYLTPQPFFTSPIIKKRSNSLIPQTDSKSSIDGISDFLSDNDLPDNSDNNIIQYTFAHSSYEKSSYQSFDSDENSNSNNNDSNADLSEGQKESILDNLNYIESEKKLLQRISNTREQLLILESAQTPPSSPGLPKKSCSILSSLTKDTSATTLEKIKQSNKAVDQHTPTTEQVPRIIDEIATSDSYKSSLIENSTLQKSFSLDESKTSTIFKKGHSFDNSNIPDVRQKYKPGLQIVTSSKVIERVASPKLQRTPPFLTPKPIMTPPTSPNLHRNSPDSISSNLSSVRSAMSPSPTLKLSDNAPLYSKQQSLSPSHSPPLVNTPTSNPASKPNSPAASANPTENQDPVIDTRIRDEEERVANAAAMSRKKWQNFETNIQINPAESQVVIKVVNSQSPKNVAKLKNWYPDNETREIVKGAQPTNREELYREDQMLINMGRTQKVITQQN